MPYLIVPQVFSIDFLRGCAVSKDSLLTPIFIASYIIPKISSYFPLFGVFKYFFPEKMIVFIETFLTISDHPQHLWVLHQTFQVVQPSFKFQKCHRNRFKCAHRAVLMIKAPPILERGGGCGSLFFAARTMVDGGGHPATPGAVNQGSVRGSLLVWLVLSTNLPMFSVGYAHRQKRPVRLTISLQGHVLVFFCSTAGSFPTLSPGW